MKLHFYPLIAAVLTGIVADCLDRGFWAWNLALLSVLLMVTSHWILWRTAPTSPEWTREELFTDACWSGMILVCVCNASREIMFGV